MVCADADDALFPTRLNVVLTRRMSGDYARAIVDRFDLAHCAVALACDADGAYRLRAARRPRRARARAPAPRARRRRLRRAAVDAATVRRIHHYLQRGFSVRGDDALFPWDDVVRRLDAAWDE